MPFRLVLLALPALAVAACSAASPSVGSSPTVAASSAVASPSAAADANATVCRQLENYRPKPTSTAEWQAYVSYAQARVDTRGLAVKLSGQIRHLIADVIVYTEGDVGALLQIQADGNQLIATCNGYGVTN
jgi:hypothetical protein